MHRLTRSTPVDAKLLCLSCQLVLNKMAAGNDKQHSCPNAVPVHTRCFCERASVLQKSGPHMHAVILAVSWLPEFVLLLVTYIWHDKAAVHVPVNQRPAARPVACIAASRPAWVTWEGVRHRQGGSASHPGASSSCTRWQNCQQRLCHTGDTGLCPQPPCALLMHVGSAPLCSTRAA